MHSSRFRLAVGATIVFSLLGGYALAANASPAGSGTAPVSLKLQSRTDLPGYTGDFDHFAADVKGNRLFLAAEDHQTLEVFDLKNGRHLKTVTGFDTPHNVLYLPEQHRLVVIDSGAGMSKIVDSENYKILDSLHLQPGADSMNYDPSTRMMFVVAGGKNGKLDKSYLYKINPRTGAKLGELSFDTDKVEAIQIEQKGSRIFVSITGKNQIAVIDKNKFAVIDTWPVSGAEMNAAMALDEARQRLFVVTRKPFKLFVLDAKSGKELTSFDAPKRTNEIMFDRKTQRIYLAGDNYMSVIQQDGADHYTELERVPTAVGAKTAIHVPEIKRMFVAVSAGEAKSGAAILRYDVLPADAVR